MTDYNITFQIRNSLMSIDYFVAWINQQIGPKAEHLYIEGKSGQFWQQDRHCSCGSQFFENGSSVCKVKCSKCGNEFDIQ